MYAAANTTSMFLLSPACDEKIYVERGIDLGRERESERERERDCETGRHACRVATKTQTQK